MCVQRALVLGLALSSLLFVLGLLVQALSLWLVIALLFGVNEQPSRVIVIVFPSSALLFSASSTWQPTSV